STMCDLPEKLLIDLATERVNVYGFLERLETDGQQLNRARHAFRLALFHFRGRIKAELNHYQ
ncbi:MAG: hypothetical protein ACRD7E_20575, partial [Bryobacteraceae bacterium]